MRKLREDNGSGNPHGEFPRTDRIRGILGEDALLLAWPLGKKATRRRWKRLRLEETKGPAYLRKLEAGNIGVALGSRSKGLCSIDLDSDQAAETFLALNPRLQKSLRTCGKKGCNVWVRCVADYPPTRKLKNRRTIAPERIGEWRADGSQTIISGKHPTGCNYSFLVEAPPISIGFEDIAWPSDWKAPCLQRSKKSGIERSHPETQASSNAAIQVGGSVDARFDMSSFVQLQEARATS